VTIVDVFLLYHVHHRYLAEDGTVLHRDESGDLTWNEDYGDDVKLLGVYSTEERARERIGRARSLPGFRDEPDCFHVDRYEVDRDTWETGYATL
jgi:hypothetical protein